jgi:hypothetical protein
MHSMNLTAEAFVHCAANRKHDSMGDVVPRLDRVPLSRWWARRHEQDMHGDTMKQIGTRTSTKAPPPFYIKIKQRPLQPASAKGWTNKVRNMSITFIISLSCMVLCIYICRKGNTCDGVWACIYINLCRFIQKHNACMNMYTLKHLDHRSPK